MPFISMAGDIVATVAGLGLVARALQDSFKVVLLPRAARSRSRTVRAFYAWSWAAWAWLGGRISGERKRDNFLAVYGPLSMVALFASWTLFLVFGFGILHWVAGPGTVAGWAGLRNAVLLSADMFFTLGSAAVERGSSATHALAVAEAGLGFGFIALTIGYLPVLYGHFSAREAYLLRFKVRAAPDWTAQDMLRFYEADDPDILARWLHDCEVWLADMMVSHNCYPMLAFYRSQRTEPSWLTAVATILDVCAVVRATGAGKIRVQPAATYAAALNFLIDLNASLGLNSSDLATRNKLPVASVRALTKSVGEPAPEGFDAELGEDIERLRATYEPELSRLSAYLMLPLPKHG